MSHERLVPGDIILLSEGDRVPADGVLLTSAYLAADESPLTGESLPVSKSSGVVSGDTPVSEQYNMVFAGTHITAGEARVLVTRTGSATQLGQIATIIATTVPEPTPLQKRLDELGRLIGWGVAALSIMIGAVVLLAEGKTDAATLAKVAMFSVALAVAAVPEGLPAVLTIALAEGAKRLAVLKAVARKMAAVKTLGSVSTILTDKTGTLTYNQMTVKALRVINGEYSIKGSGYASSPPFFAEGPVLGNLLLCGVLAGACDFQEEDGRRRAIGDPMDCALLVLAEKAGLDWRALRKDRVRISEIPFSSERARMSVVWSLQHEKTLYCKGSLERLLEICSLQLDKNGEATALSESYRQTLRETEEEYGRRGWRSLALAWRAVPYEEEAHVQETDLVLLGLVGFSDPPRENVDRAIAQAHRAGIRVAMVTGDHPHTAAAVAREVGLSDEPRVVIGSEIAKLESLEPILDADVFARVSPSQKLALAEGMISRGEVVAMTGDGVNDAPVLKRVHVGLAMGRSGTAVAVEASDIVLLNDDFSTIVAAIREGRSIFANVQRFIAFLFSGNLGVVIAMFLGTAFTGFFQLRDDGELLLPLLAAQILWMNLVTDGAPAVAFALGPSDSSTLESSPRSANAPILGGRVWLLVAVTGVTLAILFLLVLDLLYLGGIMTWTTQSVSSSQARGAAFYVLVTARLFNALSFLHLEQSILNPVSWGNRAVPAACLVSWTLTVSLFWLPWARKLFGLGELTHGTLLILTVICPLVLIPVELLKWYLRTQKRD